MVWFVVAFLAVLAGLAVWPAIAEGRRGLPDQRRAPGEMVALPDGATHARWHGPARGPVIVAIHGLATPLPMWDALAPMLGALGYRVLTYDLWGRGYSDNVAGDQDAAFFIRQLDGLLDHYGIREDITLVGHSMGGAIATAWAAARPERVKRLVLLAATGVEMEVPAALRLMVERRGPGDWLFGMAAPAILRAAVAEAPTLAPCAAGEMRRRGFVPAMLSSLRHMGQARQEAEHRSLAAGGVPVVAIWGSDDSTVSRRAPGTLAAWNRSAKQEMVEGAGHFLPVTHAEGVATLLRDVLREDWE
ncbi:MAG: alpha/beta hydrolase [Rubellimicrobium sp.]|nr:alpha/beta hydrolase [Rubellimicrobium sp.]